MIVFILFGIRIGGVLYNPMSTKLQQIAAKASTVVIQLMGIQVDISGVVITLITRAGTPAPLQVAEACSGMKIMMAFVALGALMAYMARRPWWHRPTLLLATFPIAIAANFFRVVLMGLAHYFGKPELVQGIWHDMTGLLMLPVAFGLFYLLHWIMSKLVVVEVTDEQGEVIASSDQGPRSDFIADAREFFERVGGGIASIGQGLANPDKGLKPWLRRIMPSLRERHFVIAATTMLVLAASWSIVNATVGAFFVKHPIPLKQALDRFPLEIASSDGNVWRVPEKYRKEAYVIPPEIEKTLGAKHPTRLRDGGAWAEGGEAKGVKDSADLLLQPQYIQRIYILTDESGRVADPRMTAYFFISYYTGEPDNVPHVPERCYLGSGHTQNVDVSGFPKLDIGMEKPLNVRRVQFIGQESITQRQIVSNVIYFFGFNGEFSGDHREVRLKLNSPFGKYAYYAKVEVKFPGIEDDQVHERAAEKLLADFVPIVVNDFFPDWPPADN
jgi:exosortase/archaeosortase family protein